MKRRLAILGSTGSIGTQALEVIAAHPDLFEVYALTANNSFEQLIQQALTFQPEVVVIGNTDHYTTVKEALAHLPMKVYAGADALEQIVEAEPIDMVLTAMVGYAGLPPTIRAIKSHKAIALANKETLVVAGELIMKLAQEQNAPILPVDSEHSAIFQCLIGEQSNPIEKVILTASGGPFRTLSRHQLSYVTKEQALHHPNWSMGEKITIDSATMMNKGFEVIEGKWLFSLSPKQIEVVIHPQSIIHSMVQFVDGGIKAQMGTPDMKLPIAFAFAFPQRLPSSEKRLNFAHHPSLTFEQPDMEKFPCLQLAYRAMEQGGTMPCVLNAANEIAVDAFLQDRISFVNIARVIEQTMDSFTPYASPTYSDYVETNLEARNKANEFLK